MKETVEHIARLANLEFAPEQIDEFAEQFSKILGYIDTINQLDLDGVQPLTQVVDLENIMRNDFIKPSLSLQDALKNAPKKNENFIKVPKVIE